MERERWRALDDRLVEAEDEAARESDEGEGGQLEERVT